MTANVPAHINPATASLPATYESAKTFLEQMPTAETLMPILNSEEVQKLIGKVG